MKIQDILLFDDQLTDEELIIQKSARDYCQKELLPRITVQIEMKYLIKVFIKKWLKWDFLVLP